MTKEIQLTQGKVALVDDDDFEWLNQYKWCAVHVARNQWYAQRRKNYRNIYMHKFLLNTPSDMEIDHIDGDGLNNTRSNMRVCTHKENMKNKRMHHDNKCGYKGVCAYGNKYEARITIDGNYIKIGTFNTIIEAARAYDNAARELFGEFANLNFPDDNLKSKNHY